MKVKVSPFFQKNVKTLQKKHNSINKDVIELINELKKDPFIGTNLGNNRYKIRVKNSDSNKGKSGGYRVITYIKVDDFILLVTIYSKSTQESIPNNEIDLIIKNYKNDLEK
jgi:mRNA-degrading endonuclease RelE of RelBE toxin-antitoxin system